MFEGREQAGRRLARRLAELLPQAERAEALVLGIPRGGVIVAAPVAAALGAPLDVIVPRKIGAPHQPELAVGAIALAGEEEILRIDAESVRQLGVPESYLAAEAQRQRREIRRREAVYRGERAMADARERTVLIVDDGVATGLTALVAAEAVQRLGPRQVIVAVPVAAPETVREFEREGVRLTALEAPFGFMSVGQFYADFHPVEDDEVLAALGRG